MVQGTHPFLDGNEAAGLHESLALGVAAPTGPSLIHDWARMKRWSLSMIATDRRGQIQRFTDSL